MNPGVFLFLPAKLSDRIKCASVLTIASRKHRRHWEVEPHHLASGPAAATRLLRGEWHGRTLELEGVEYLHLIEIHAAKSLTERRTMATFLRVRMIDGSWQIVAAEYLIIPDGIRGRIAIERHTLPEEK